jgi:hypothetical protein
MPKHSRQLQEYILQVPTIHTAVTHIEEEIVSRAGPMMYAMWLRAMEFVGTDF